MEPFELRSASDLDDAAILAAENHRRLRAALPFLKPRDRDHFRPKLAWLADRGRILALRPLSGGMQAKRGLRAFLGGFVSGDFRNSGPGAYCPEWAHGLCPDSRGEEQAQRQRTDPYPALYRTLAAGWMEEGGPGPRDGALRD